MPQKHFTLEATCQVTLAPSCLLQTFGSHRIENQINWRFQRSIRYLMAAAHIVTLFDYGSSQYRHAVTLECNESMHKASHNKNTNPQKVSASRPTVIVRWHHCTQDRKVLIALQNPDVATCPRTCPAANKYCYEILSWNFEIDISKS